MYKDLPIGTKKTLVTKLSFDITGKSGAFVEALKTMIRQGYIDSGMKSEDISFEVLVNNERDAIASMLNAVRSEFKASEEEIAESEKSDGFADFLSLFSSLFEDEEDARSADEAEDTDDES